MGDKSKIQWTDATWNPVTGCTQVSPGCDHCYAEKMSNRLSHLPKYAGVSEHGRWTGRVIVHPGEVLSQPLRWQKPRRIFVCSMSDLFHSSVPFDFISQVFDVMAMADWHTFQVLTKRPGRMAHFAEKVWPCHRPEGEWPKNVWAGTSVESQKYAPRLDMLARVPAQVRFVSAEPLLGPLDLTHIGKQGINALTGEWSHYHEETGDVCTHWEEPLINWCIVGGESGPGARPMHPQWGRDIRDQCQQFGVPFFFKQWGEYRPLEHSDLDFSQNEFGDCPYPLREVDSIPRLYSTSHGTGYITTRTLMIRVGKKAAGAVLDGREWQEMPNV